MSIPTFLIYIVLISHSFFAKVIIFPNLPNHTIDNCKGGVYVSKKYCQPKIGWQYLNTLYDSYVSTDILL